MVTDAVGEGVTVLALNITGYDVNDATRQLNENARAKRKIARRLASVVVKYDVVLEQRCKELTCGEEILRTLFADVTSYISDEIQKGGFTDAL